MKKSLIAAALLGTFAASAFAAPSVTLYGRIDTGLAYTHQHWSADGAGEDSEYLYTLKYKESEDSLSMQSGFSTGNRWGLTGTEDIGNAKVGFVLESGFNSDDGASGQGGRLFGREAQVNVSGAYGTLYAGRIASIVSDSGSIGYLGDVSAFPNAFGFVGSQAGSTGSAYGRYDNTLAYQTPVFSGLQAAVMYSFKADSKTDTTSRENSSFADRYAAAGLRYKAGKAAVVLAADYTMYSNATNPDLDDGYSVILGGNYDFGAAKVFAKATYFDNQASVTDSFEIIDAVREIAAEDDLAVARAFKGWGVELGTNVPAFGGNFIATVGYRDAKDSENSAIKLKRWNAAVGYSYAFSKRTSIYAAAGYAQEKGTGHGVVEDLDLNITSASIKGSGAHAGFGLVHKF